jgi:hypothetical protein
VCVCVCVCVCVSVCVCVYLNTLVCVFLCVCDTVCVYIHIHTGEGYGTLLLPQHPVFLMCSVCVPNTQVKDTERYCCINTLALAKSMRLHDISSTCPLQVFLMCSLCVPNVSLNPCAFMISPLRALVYTYIYVSIYVMLYIHSYMYVI